MSLRDDHLHGIAQPDRIDKKEKRLQRPPNHSIVQPIKAPYPARPTLPAIFQQVLHAPDKVESAGAKPDVDYPKSCGFTEKLQRLRAIRYHSCGFVPGFGYFVSVYWFLVKANNKSLARSPGTISENIFDDPNFSSTAAPIRKTNARLSAKRAGRP